MSNHIRPNNRPIHPRCLRLIDREYACQCTREWRGWDGTAAGLRRAIKLWQRLEARNRSSNNMGAAPDDYETELHVGLGSSDVLDGSGLTVGDLLAGQTGLEHSGFWKESEFLKTTTGQREL